MLLRGKYRGHRRKYTIVCSENGVPSNIIGSTHRPLNPTGVNGAGGVAGTNVYSGPPFI